MDNCQDNTLNNSKTESKFNLDDLYGFNNETLTNNFKHTVWKYCYLPFQFFAFTLFIIGILTINDKFDMLIEFIIFFIFAISLIAYQFYFLFHAKIVSINKKGLNVQDEIIPYDIIISVNFKRFFSLGKFLQITYVQRGQKKFIIIINSTNLPNKHKKIYNILCTLFNNKK